MPEDLVDFEESNDVPMVFVCVLVVLLVLLAAAIWIAFFSALRKAVKRFTEMKEYRRRQNVLAALSNGPIGNLQTSGNGGFAPFALGCDQSLTGAYIRQISAVLSVPPTYEEAIRQQQHQPAFLPVTQQSPSVANSAATLVADSRTTTHDAAPVAATTLSHLV